jgi:NADH-quinone oxidoreductase subunit M
MSSLLTLVTFLPVVGAVLVLLLPRRQEPTTKWLTMGTTLVTFLVSLPVYFRFDSTSADYQFVEQRPGSPRWG